MQYSPYIQCILQITVLCFSLNEIHQTQVNRVNLQSCSLIPSLMHVSGNTGKCFLGLSISVHYYGYLHVHKQSPKMGVDMYMINIEKKFNILFRSFSKVKVKNN